MEEELEVTVERRAPRLKGGLDLIVLVMSVTASGEDDGVFGIQCWRKRFR